VRRFWPFIPAIILASCYFHERGSGGTGGAELGKGSACNGFAPNDPCNSAGLACTPDLADGGFSCQPPGPLYACDPNIGCSGPGIVCVQGTCLQRCKATADCADPLTTCAAIGLDAGSFCLVNPCGGPGSTGFWQACNAASGDGGDGTCIVLYQDPRNGPQGACQQGGSVPAGGACNFYRSDAGASFCAPGLLCMVDASGDNAGICLPACDPFSPGLGPTCAAGSSCVPTTLPLPPPAVSYDDFYDETGACAQSCTPGDAGAKADAGDPPGHPPPGDPGDAGPQDDGGLDGGGALDAGPDAGAADAGPTPDAGSADAGGAGTVPDAGSADAGGPAPAGCAAPLSCQDGSLTSTADFVCLP